MARFTRRSSPKERWRRDAYLAAIGELGGDEAAEAATRLWPDAVVDDRTRVMLDFQGRKLRGRMEELGITIGDLAGRSGIDTVTLVAILFGLEEMTVGHWIGLTDGLEVPFGWTLEGIRFVPRDGPEGRGITSSAPGTMSRPRRQRVEHPTTTRAVTHDEAPRRGGDRRGARLLARGAAPRSHLRAAERGGLRPATGHLCLRRLAPLPLHPARPPDRRPRAPGRERVRPLA